MQETQKSTSFSFSTYLKSAFSFLTTLSVYSMFPGFGESKSIEHQHVGNIGNKSLVNATVKGFEIGRSNFPFNSTAYDIAVQDNYAYVASGVTGIQMVDLNKPSSPIASFKTAGFARQIDIINQSAWIATDQNGIYILNISDPTKINSNDLFHTNYQSTYPYPAAKLRAANSHIFLASSNNPSLAILDNTTSPKTIIGTTYSENRGVYDIFSLDNEAYIAHPGIGVTIIDAIDFPKAYNFVLPKNAIPSDTFVIRDYSLVASDKGLQILDIAVPMKPKVLGEYATSNQASSIFAINNTAYLTDTQGLYLVDFTHPQNPTLISSLNAKNVSAVYVYSKNKLAYLAQKNKGLQVVDLSNPVTPVLKGPAYKMTEAQDVVIDTSGRIAYVAAGKAGLQVIDIRDSDNLKLFGSLVNDNGKGNAQAVAVLDNILCIADGPNGLGVIDVSDPNNPKLLGSYPTNNAVDVSIIEQTVYLNDQKNGLYVFDISRFGVPELLCQYASIAGNLRGLSTSNSKAYIASDAGVQIMDAPLWKGRIADPTTPMQIAASTNNLYIASFKKILYTYDTRNRSNPLLLSKSHKLQDFVRDIVITKDYLFLSEGNSGIEILNIHNPAQPLSVGKIQAGLWNARGLNLVGKNLYVADDSGGLVIYLIDIQPLIQTNQLFIFPNQTIVLGLENLNVIDPDNLPNTLTLTISNLTNGFFAKLPDNTTHVVNFTLDDIINKKIQFTANGSNAPSYEVKVSDGHQFDGPYRSLVFYNQQPILLNKTIEVNQGTPLIITRNNIDAEPVSNNVNPYNLTAMRFIVNDISNAYFVFSQNLTAHIDQFTQQDIVDGIVKLIPNSTKAPNITISLSNGAITLAPQVLNIIFHGVHHVPQIVNNTLVINEGRPTILTLDQVCAYNFDTSSYDDNLQFSVNTIGHGRFSKVNTTTILGQFLQKDIKEGNIQFIPTSKSKSLAPFYDISVATLFNSTGFMNGSVNFDPLPRLIQNKLTITKGGSVVFTVEQLQAIIIVGSNNSRTIYVPEKNASLIFEISQIKHGHFEFLNHPNISIDRFSQEQMTNNQVQFVHDGSDKEPQYFVSVHGKRTASESQKALISFINQQNANNIPAIAGGAVAGAVCLAGLLAGAGFFAKRYQDIESRKLHPLARYLRRHLHLKGIDSFNSEEGNKFVATIELLIDELKNEGLDNYEQWNNDQIESLAKKLADIMKNDCVNNDQTLNLEKVRNEVSEIIKEVKRLIPYSFIKNQTLNSGEEKNEHKDQTNNSIRNI